MTAKSAVSRPAQVNQYADGLRGIASLNVALCHYFGFFWPVLLAKNYPDFYAGDPDPSPVLDVLRFPLINVLYNGQFAVLVFFVLSGYVLTIPYYAGRREVIEKRFWGRYLRLNIPVFFSVLFAWLLYYGNPFSGDGATYFVQMRNEAGDASIGVLEMLKEGLFTGILMGESDLNFPLWSIGAEFIGSLLLLAFFMQRSKRRLILIALVFALGAATYSNSVTYLAAIFLGAQIIRVKGTKLKMVLFGAIGIYLGGYQEGSIYYSFLAAETYVPSTKNVLNMFGALFLTTAVINGFGATITNNALSRFLGRISFPLYILHYPLLLTFAKATYDFFPSPFAVNWLHLLAFLGVSIAAAYLFERFIDQPAIAVSKRFSAAVMARLKAPKA